MISHLSYSRNSLKRLYKGALQGLFRGILGVWTTAHIGYLMNIGDCICLGVQVGDQKLRDLGTAA